MEAILESLNNEVKKMSTNVVPSTGKRQKWTKTDRLKAVNSVFYSLSKKSTRLALTAASKFEMVRGPPDELSEDIERVYGGSQLESSGGKYIYIGWMGLSTAVFEVLCEACSEAVSSKTTSKSGHANLKPDYMRCFKRVVKYAIQDGPPGVIRSIVPSYLYFAYEQLHEPRIVNSIADDVWVCTRDILQDESNRAIVQPTYIQHWLEVCFQQLVGRGSIKFTSDVSSRVSGELFKILATPVDSFDVLKQSKDRMSAVKMNGGDFSYSLIGRLCCLALIVANNRPKRQARELQRTVFNVLTLVLTEHSFEFCDSNTLKSIINVCMNPILSCWIDRKTHEAAVSLTNIILKISPNHKKFVLSIRSRLHNDLVDRSNALLHAGKDVKDDYIETAASCYSFLQALEFASASDAAEGHIIIWLRVASTIMSCRILKFDTCILINLQEVFDQCTRAAEVISQIIPLQNKKRGSSFNEIIHWSCELVDFTASTANRIFLAGYSSKSPDLSKWCNLYQTLAELVSSLSFSGRTSGISRVSEGLNIEESLARSLSFLSTLYLIDHSSLDFAVGTNSFQTFKMPFPISKIMGTEKCPSLVEIQLLRNILARNGFSDEGTGLRYRLVERLVSFCEHDDNSFTTPQFYIEASATILGLSRGECGISDNNLPPALASSSSSSLASLHREMLFFGQTVGLEKIRCNGSELVSQMRDQDLIWTRHLRLINPNSAMIEQIDSVFDKNTDIEDSLPSLSRHFAISSNLSIQLERNVVSKLSSMFKSLCNEKSTNDEDQDRMEEDENEGEKLRFRDNDASKKGLRILLFTCNYLLIGLKHGLMNNTDSSIEGRDVLKRFISLAIKLLICLNEIDITVLSEAPELSKASILTCCNFRQTLEKEDLNQKWNYAVKSIQTLLSNFSARLGKHFMKRLLDAAKANKKKISKYANEELDDPNSSSGNASRKRGRSRGSPGPARKRGRFDEFEDENSFSQDQDHGFPRDSDGNMMNDGNEQRDSDSEDDFGDKNFEVKGTQPIGGKTNLEVEGLDRELSTISELLKIMVKKVQSANEVFFSNCKVGLDRLKDVEVLSAPDGFERQALFSPLIGPTSFIARQYLWDILLHIDSAPSAHEAGQDLFKLGRYWKDLESTSANYTLTYADENFKAKIPVLSELENARVVFLKYAVKFLEKLRALGKTEVASYSEKLRLVCSGLVDIVDSFRLRHGLRMPRRTKIAYLKFGETLIPLHNESLLSDPNHSSEESVLLSLHEKVGNTRAAMCKLLSDADATVRFTAARIIPKILSSWEHFPISEVEKILEDNLPTAEMCAEDPFIYGSKKVIINIDNIGDASNRFKLSEDEHNASLLLSKAFRQVGSKSKSLSTLIALAELAVGRDDFVPFFFIQALARIAKQRSLVTPTYSVISRICIATGLKSPKRLYKAFSRVILSRLFSSPSTIDTLYTFPAELVLDEDQNRDGATYDWLEEETPNILPHVLANDEVSLHRTKEFASKLDLDVADLFKKNVPSYMVVYPMLFMPDLHERGLEMWQAIEEVLNNQAMYLMTKRKDDVVAFLLMYSSGNFGCRYAAKNRKFDVENTKGFNRDTRSLKPPFYDPLVVALAINQLHRSTDDISLCPKNEIKGPLFSEVLDVDNSNRLDDFTAFVKEYSKPTSSLLKCLLATSTAIDPVLTCTSLYNRLDAYFCLGLLWKMLDTDILLKPGNERIMFYKLISKGFHHVETTYDASWLLLDVQQKLMVVKAEREDAANFDVYPSDLSIHPEHREHLTELETTTERQMYELMNCICPVLVSIIANNGSLEKSPLRDSANAALRRLLVMCQSNEMWSVIMCGGAFPGGQHFKEARKIYEKAVMHVEGNSEHRAEIQTTIVLKRFNGIYHQHKSQSIVSSLACLQDLRRLLTDSNAQKLSQQMQREACLKSNGEPLPTTSLIQSSIASLISLLRDLSGEISKNTPTLQPLLVSNESTTRGGSRLEDQVLRAVSDVFNTIGLIQGRSFGFVHADSHCRSIPAKHISGEYESFWNGIHRSMLCMVDVLRSGSSIAAESAMKALVVILQTDHGKSLLSSNSDFKPIMGCLRLSDRKGSSYLTSIANKIGLDPRTGEKVSLALLSPVDDSALWKLSRYTSQHEDGHEEWLRNVCAQLCSKCRSTAYQALAGVCFTSYQLCCDVLPYLLMDIVDIDRDSNSDPILITCISDLILNEVLRNPDTPIDILKIFVHAFDVLCQIGLTAITKDKGKKSGIHGWYKKTLSDVKIIPYFYVLDIPYSEVVQVALKCGASFSAIRYSHLYIDHKVMEKGVNMRENDTETSKDKRSRLDNGKDPLLHDIEIAALENAKPWIRRAMTQISEKDSLRAFSPNQKLAESAECLSNLEEEWSLSLATIGVASHSSNLSSVISDNHSMTPRKEGVDLRRELDTFQALMGMGNLTLACNYWDGLLNKIGKDGLREPSDPFLNNDTLAREINDLRYAAAWKLERWEDPGLISTKIGNDGQFNNFFCGFHHAVYRILYYMKADRSFEIPQCLNLARRQILNKFCHDSAGVSAQKIFESAAQLRVLQVFESTKPSANNAVANSESAGWSLGSTPQMLRAPGDGSLDGFSRLMRKGSSSSQQSSSDLEIMLGDSHEINDSDSLGVIPSRTAFNNNILTDDLPVVLIRCLGLTPRVAQAAADASWRIQAQEDSGAWARAACCFGTSASSFIEKASKAHRSAWKLQECQLRWSASGDAKTRKQALLELNNLISSDLGGEFVEKSLKIKSNADLIEKEKSLQWTNDEGTADSERLGFIRSEACRLVANWSLEMKTDEPNVLFESYLKPGLKAAQGSKIEKVIGQAHFAVASFADVQIGNITNYRKSEKYMEMVKSIKNSEDQVKQLQTMRSDNKIGKKKQASRRKSRLSSEASGVSNKVDEDVKAFINRTLRQTKLDRERFDKINDSYKDWLLLACKHFAASLRYGTTQDLRAAFRLVALWLDSKEMRETVTEFLLRSEKEKKPGLSHMLTTDVPVGKLLPLAPQLFSRLNFSDKSKFQKILANTATQMSGKYPAYCLWQLLALSNATLTCGSGERMTSLYKGDSGKRDAANDIFRRLTPQFGEVVKGMKTVAEAYIALTEISASQKAKKNEVDIGRMELCGLKELPHVKVPTIALPMHPSDDHYDSLPYIAGFKRNAKVLGGLSAPLRVKCIGSDGQEYLQIAKGRDDLRGDAVFEQLFTIMNSLLEQDSEASKRNLYIRTYRIIPISPFTGIMQFVTNSAGFKDLLVETKQENERYKKTAYPLTSLHDRYRPKDMKHGDITLRAHGDYRKRSPLQTRLNYFRYVWIKFQPVFRYFFLEQWPDAAEWFNHQMNYSRSVAVMSMVGFILGLGDRHLSNIMVDTNTAEVVHIDFGIAFEFGKVLPQPEHMPFRLTRDLVDGFGVAGVEGVFRKCCEIALSVMRRNKDVLLTVLEVLLHDPMFNWDLTPEDVLREQMSVDNGNDKGGQSNRNKKDEDIIETESPIESDSHQRIAGNKEGEQDGSREALRALNRILEKLDGLEGTERLSVEAHVARLIDEAQAFHIIAPVFPGWTPWL